MYKHGDFRISDRGEGDTPFEIEQYSTRYMYGSAKYGSWSSLYIEVPGRYHVKDPMAFATLAEAEFALAGLIRDGQTYYGFLQMRIPP